MSIDLGAVDFISRERGIDPAFFEKDWYAVQVLKALAAISYHGITTIFTGGTSLSKGHGLLERFSEDLDFRARFETDPPPDKTRKRAFRNGIIDTLKNVEGVTLDEDAIVIDGLGFKLFLSYPNHFDSHDGLRPNLQIEFSYTQPRLVADTKAITSFVAEYKGEESETNILCLSPVEIAADKFSSLTWRILKRDRSSEKDDPSMIRHLHDLCALHEIIKNNQELFTQTALTSFAIDQERHNRNVGLSLAQASQKTLDTLHEDQFYLQEYKQFVDEMSYADDSSIITFDMALLSFENIISTQ